MYFLLEGRVGVLTGTQKVCFKQIVKGSYFGDIEIFSRSARLFDTIAIVKTNLVVIGKEDLLNLLKRFPEYELEMVRNATMRQRKIVKNLKKVLKKTANKKVKIIPIKVQPLLEINKHSIFWSLKASKSLYFAVKNREDPSKYYFIEKAFREANKRAKNKIVPLKNPTISMTDELTLLSKLYINLVKNTETLVEAKKRAILRKKSLNIITQPKKGEHFKNQKRCKTYTTGVGSKRKCKEELPFETQNEKSSLDQKIKCQEKVKEKEAEAEKRKSAYRRKLSIINTEHKGMEKKTKHLNIHSEGELEDGLQTPPRLINDKHLESNENYKKLLQFESVNRKYGESSHSKKKSVKKIKKEAVLFPELAKLKSLKSLFMEKKLEGLEVNLDKVVDHMNMLMEENRILKGQLKEKRDCSVLSKMPDK